MTKYQEFLKECNIILEEDFNEIINSLPEYDVSNINPNVLDSSLDGTAQIIIDAILSKWYYVYSDEVDFANKTITLEDVNSLEDLEDIKNTFSNWTISNYEEIKNNFIEEEEENREDEELAEKRSLFNSVIEDISIDELKEIIKKYANKKRCPQSCS